MKTKLGLFLVVAFAAFLAGCGEPRYYHRDRYYYHSRPHYYHPRHYHRHGHVGVGVYFHN